MRIKSWNLLTFVIVLFMCSVLFVCLNVIFGTNTICVAENGSADGYWGFPIDPGMSPPNLYPDLGGMGWWRAPSQLEIAVTAAGLGDITTLTKYTRDIGISSYGQPASTNIAYPTVAGMSIPRSDFGYSMSTPNLISQSWATRDWSMQNKEWLTVGTLYDPLEMMTLPMWPSSIFSPTPPPYARFGDLFDNPCWPMGCNWYYL